MYDPFNNFYNWLGSNRLALIYYTYAVLFFLLYLFAIGVFDHV